MAKLTTEASRTSSQTTSKDFGNVTFSQAFRAGLTHSGWLVGPTTDPYGQEAALASHSALPEKAKGLKTSATFGPLFGGSSPSEDLQLSLASRLRARMAVYGSMEYDLTWKQWDMLSEPPICALRASGRRTSGKGCSGWPTPRSITGGPESAERKQELGRPKSGGGDLQAAALAAGWPTLVARDHKNSMGDGSNPRDLPRTTALIDPGRKACSSPAPTGKPEGYRLNPLFSLWLMGFPPVEWASCAGLEMPSSRR